MDSLEFDGQKYISTKGAAEITGYAKDYVGQLCREGRIVARLIGRSWYVSEASIREHRFGKEEMHTEESPVVEETKEVVAEEPTHEVVGTVQYVQEEVAPLPTLKEEQEEETTSLAEEAWREWFDTKKQAGTESKTVEENKVVIQDIEPAPVKIERVERPIEVTRQVQKRQRRVQGEGVPISMVSAALIGLILIMVSVTLLITGSVEKYVEKAPISGPLLYLGGTSIID